MISTLTLEDVISQYPLILECAATVYLMKNGMPPLCFIALKEGQQATPEDVNNWMLKFAENGVIEKWWIPDVPTGYIFIDAIPHNYIGKIEKTTLRKMYADMNQK